MDVFANILHRGTIEELAGSPIFARGERYFAEGRVQSAERAGSELRGVVHGGASYRCRIWVKGNGLAYHCDCPYSADQGAYCKHLVALALSWLARSDGTERSACSARVEHVQLHDARSIEAFLRRDVWLNLYQLGDLDRAFFGHTTWHARLEQGTIMALALLYSGLTLPCLLALGADSEPLGALLGALPPLLPPRFYCHLTPGIGFALRDAYRLAPRGRHFKMALRDLARATESSARDAVRLGPEHREEVRAFYDASYPGHWFDAQLLETGCYFGRRAAGQLVGVAGVHVLSRAQRVAALGNVATRPDARGRGHARALMARVCGELRAENVQYIGLNVQADNAAAIRCYEHLGFEVVAEYEEHSATLRAPPAGSTGGEGGR
jgi:ribosomal protein S18 acetylase RimI-like enzyme